MRLLIAAAALALPVAAFAAYRRSLDTAGQGAADLPPDLSPQILDTPSFLENIGVIDMLKTRGERNNNPGNIRKSGATWIGKTAGADPAFETFATPGDGIRALAKLLKTYQAQGLYTVSSIIRKYAPPNENNTAAYIARVAAAVGVGPNDRIDLGNPATLATLTAAIIAHENGRNVYASSEILNAVSRA